MAPVHPGEILLEEFLGPLGVSQYKLAKAVGVPARRTNEIIHGQRRISADVTSVVADPALVGLPDDQVPAYAATEGRALVTANIKDFVPLDGRYRAASQSHAGLILISTKTFPQNRGFPSAITTAVATLLSGTAKIQSGLVLFLTRG